MTRPPLVRLLVAAALAWAVACPRARPQSDDGAAGDTTGEQKTQRNPSARRDPFWPLGWRPPNFGRSDTGGAKVTEQVRWDEAVKRLRVTGLTRKPNGAYLAIIRNAGIVEKGDVVSVHHDSLVYRWKIVDITSAGIVPEQIGVSRE